MRPIATDQDLLRCPLNELLGTRGNVRLLRLLSVGVAAPVGAPEAAERTGLTEAGARRALRGLVKGGIVEQVGGGRGQRFQLRAEAPLAAQVRALFAAELERFHSLLSRLRETFASLPEIRVGWIDSAPLSPGTPLHLGLVSDPHSLGYVESEVRRRLASTETEYDLTIEIHAFSRADAPEVDWERVVLLAGQVEEPTRPSGTTHADREARAERISRAVADLLDRDETLISRAITHLDALLRQDQEAAAHDLGEWRDILARYSRHRLKEFLVSDSPRARRLRQSSPFFAVLTPDERDHLFDQIETPP